jgi:hypothetical protein
VNTFRDSLDVASRVMVGCRKRDDLASRRTRSAAALRPALRLSYAKGIATERSLANAVIMAVQVVSCSSQMVRLCRANTNMLALEVQDRFENPAVGANLLSTVYATAGLQLRQRSGELWSSRRAIAVTLAFDGAQYALLPHIAQ